jgi:prepilin-type N-terminal cleavage/methylation domain-containing protein
MAPTRHAHPRGFTLLELVFSIMLIGIVAFAVIFTVTIANSKTHDLVPETKWVAHQLNEYRPPVSPSAASRLVTKVVTTLESQKWNLATHVVSSSHSSARDQFTFAFGGSSQRACLTFAVSTGHWGTSDSRCKK